ncbi:MAG: hypothetical protein DMD29_02315 [Gemmatimonadetes bacterium]|nr:MAG: hypothetical protein DMD29_02315 [Gemmatimonadota bacterium]
MRKSFAVLCGVLLAGLAACQQPLDVNNQNQSDVDRTLATPADLETFIGTTYVVAHQATLGGSNDGLQTQLQVMGFENVSGLANFAMGPRGAIPRPPITNTPNATGDAGNQFDFFRGHRAARMATMGLAALKIPRLGTTALGSVGRDRRARAFAHFSLGVALGNLALAYDSASILSEFDDFKAAIPLSGYRAVMTEALKHLDSAIAIVRGDSATNANFPLPTTWISVPSTVTLDTLFFIRLARSYRARFRADVARTPAERADISAGGIVDWAKIIPDADSGIALNSGDLFLAMNPNTGWDVVWPAQAFATGSANWHQMSQFILGMSDTTHSGTVYAYDTWLSTTRFSRAPFMVVTPDKRFPQGTTRALQIADTAQSRSFTGRPYWRNRPDGEDQPVDPFGMSMYDFYRSKGFNNANRIGNYPVMTRTEMRILAAEGYIRTGSFATAIARINVSRTAANAALPAIPATITDTVTVVPGGTACVPRVPDAAQNFRGSKCGNLWDAMKYEYRVETAYCGYGMWFFAGRGWGDIPEGTALNWPVPWEELFVRSMPIYGTGGLGGPESSGRGSYGLFDGGVYGW